MGETMDKEDRVWMGSHRKVVKSVGPRASVCVLQRVWG